MGKRQRKRKWLVEGAQPADGVPRRLRVEGDVHQQLVRALRELGDPRLRGAVVTRVQMTDDLQLVSVYVRADVAQQDSPQMRDGVLAALNAARKRLRRHLGNTLSLRYTPNLRFFYDRGHDAAQRVDELLAEIAAERADTESADSDAAAASTSELDEATADASESDAAAVSTSELEAAAVSSPESDAGLVASDSVDHGESDKS